MAEPEKIYVDGCIRRDGSDPDDVRLNGIQTFDGGHYLPASRVDAAVADGYDGSKQIILFARMLPPPAAGIAIPFSPVTAREMAQALINMATEVEQNAAAQAAAALQKAARK